MRMHMCLLKLPKIVNFLSQTLQLKGRSPLGVGTWYIKWLDSQNDLLQVLQLKGRSSEWMRMRTVFLYNLAFWLKYLNKLTYLLTY